MSRKIHIIGAGPIGLVIAWQFAQKGIKVNLYEKNNIVGGMCRTWKWKNFLVDTGPHIFHTPDKEFSKLLGKRI